MKKIFLTFLLIPFTLISFGFSGLLYSQSQETTETADLKKEGACTSGNCENGQGTFKYNNGEAYIGLWKDGKRQGKGASIINRRAKYLLTKNPIWMVIGKTFCKYF